MFKELLREKADVAARGELTAGGSAPSSPTKRRRCCRRSGTGRARRAGPRTGRSRSSPCGAKMRSDVCGGLGALDAGPSRDGKDCTPNVVSHGIHAAPSPYDDRSVAGPGAAVACVDDAPRSVVVFVSAGDLGGAGRSAARLVGAGGAAGSAVSAPESASSRQPGPAAGAARAWPATADGHRSFRRIAALPRGRSSWTGG